MTSTVTREAAADLVAGSLLNRASRLTRLLLRTGGRELSRTGASVLGTLAAGPRRITELADTEALAQPTVTQLVDRLERNGFVAKERSPHDGRVVVVTITDAGRDQLARLRQQVQGQLREAVLDLDDADLQSLAAATEALQRLIDSLVAT